MKVCQVALRELESLLSCVEYVVEFGLIPVPLIPGGTAEQYITAALGPGTVVEGAEVITGVEMLAEVERCISWPGGPGYGPFPAAIQSPLFEELVRLVLAYLRHAVAQATAVVSFWLSDGHPFHPVTWGFEYLVLGPSAAVVFLGASSD